MFLKVESILQDLVLGLDLHRKLEHKTSTFTNVGFSPDGDILVSVSFDGRIGLWDWQFGHTKLSFHPGHIHYVLQAKTMPFSNGRSIVTCAFDGQVCVFFSSATNA